MVLNGAASSNRAVAGCKVIYHCSPFPLASQPAVSPSVSVASSDPKSQSQGTGFSPGDAAEAAYAECLLTISRDVRLGVDIP